MSNTVIIGRRYKHHSGRVYVAKDIANTHSDDGGKFPETVIYFWEGDTQILWSRPVSDFKKKFNLIPHDNDVLINVNSVRLVTEDDQIRVYVDMDGESKLVIQEHDHGIDGEIDHYVNLSFIKQQKT